MDPTCTHTKPFPHFHNKHFNFCWDSFFFQRSGNDTKKNNSVGIAVFPAQQSLLATQAGTFYKATQSCNSIFVVKACQAMTTGSCLLCTLLPFRHVWLLHEILTSCTGLFVYRQSLSSHLCPCPGREFLLWRRDAGRDPDGFTVAKGTQSR